MKRQGKTLERTEQEEETQGQEQVKTSKLKKISKTSISDKAKEKQEVDPDFDSKDSQQDDMDKFTSKKNIKIKSRIKPTGKIQLSPILDRSKSGSGSGSGSGSKSESKSGDSNDYSGSESDPDNDPETEQEQETQNKYKSSGDTRDRDTRDSKEDSIRNDILNDFDNILLKYFKPIAAYYKNKYNTEETSEDLIKISSRLGTNSNIMPSRSSLGINNIRLKRSITGQKSISEDVNRCEYIISKGKPTEHQCPKSKCSNSNFCSVHTSTIKKKENVNSFEGDSPSETTINHSKRFKVAKFDNKDIDSRFLFLHKNKYLIHKDDLDKIHVIASVTKDNDNYILKELTTADQSSLKEYDGLIIKNIKYLFQVVYKDVNEDDIPFIPE